MTDYAKMSDIQLSIAVAERLEWSLGDSCWYDEHGMRRKLPDFPGSLDAAKALMDESKPRGWRWRLYADSTSGCAIAERIASARESFMECDALPRAVTICWLQLKEHEATQ